MDSREKKQLKRQLEGQASLLVSENSDVALVAGLLTTCSALLRTAEQNMPAAFTNQEFDQIYAGYLGLAGGVNRFSQFGQGYLSQTYKTLLQEQMDKATQLQQERKTLEDQLTQTQHQQAETQQVLTQLKAQRDSAQAEHQAAKTQKDQLTQEVSDLQSKTEALKAQRDSLQRQKERFEPDLEALLQAVTAAKESYQELVAKGYLSEAVMNYICLLGWSPKGEYAEQEIFSLEELIKIWSPDGISKSPAIFDPLKLRAINAEYIRRLSPEEFQKKAEPWIDQAVHTPIDKKLLCANLQPRCEVLGEIPEQLDFFDAMPDYDVSLYANKKQKTTPETAREALEALLPLLSDESLDFSDRDTVFNACKAKAEELGKKNGWLLYPLGIALSGKQRTPGGGTDLACMMGREKTLERVKAAIEKLNG